MTKKSLGAFCSVGLVLCACIWGFAFVVVKDSLDYIGPVWMIAFRFSIAAFCLGLLLRKRLLGLTKKTFMRGMLLGFFLFMAYLLQTIGCKFTTAGKNAFLTTVYVVLVPLFAWPLFRKRPSWYVFAAALMSVSGIGLLALKNEGNILSMNKGDVLTLSCGIFYALHILFTSHFNAYDDPLLLTVLQFAVAAFLGWICAPFMDGAFPLEIFTNARVLLSVFYLGLLSTLVCFVLQNVGLKYVAPALASLFLSLESLFGVLFSTLLLHEAVTLRMLLGCGLIFFAIILAEVVPEVVKGKEAIV
jgi:drug/metabolite transporter (DMT)-like permease